jgi:hypothetical protein
MSELFVFHGLLKARGLLPEEAFPSREVGALEKGMLKDALDTTKSLDHISAVVVEVPQLSIMFLMSPPEGILFEDLILLKVLSNSPTLIIGKGKSIFLEQGINTRNTSIPGVLKIIKSESPVLGSSLLPLESILSPYSLRVKELGLP